MTLIISLYFIYSDLHEVTFSVNNLSDD